MEENKDLKIRVSNDGGETYKNLEDINTRKYDPKSLWKFVKMFGGIIAIAVVGALIWTNYLGPDARNARRMQNQYEAYLQWEQKYKEAMKNDTYGGKTPEETLAMFIDALKKDDLELASKYFLIDNKVPQSEWLAGLQKSKDEGRLGKIIEDLGKATRSNRNTESDGSIEMTALNDLGEVGYSVMFIINKESNLWKIESL